MFVTVAFLSVLLLIALGLLPSGRLFWLLFSFSGLLLSLVWGQYFFSQSQPDYQASAGSAIGLSWLAMLTVAFLLGSFLSYCRWVFQLASQAVVTSSDNSD